MKRDKVEKRKETKEKEKKKRRRGERGIGNPLSYLHEKGFRTWINAR